MNSYLYFTVVFVTRCIMKTTSLIEHNLQILKNLEDASFVSLEDNNKYTITLSETTIGIGIAIFSATFTPVLPVSIKCTYNVWSSKTNKIKNTSTECNSIKIDHLNGTTEYSMNFYYGSQHAIKKFKTLNNHTISSNVKSTCTSATVFNTFDPIITQFKGDCNSSMSNYDGTPFPCSSYNCQHTCSAATFYQLKANTKYIYYIGANPSYTDINRSYDFTTLSHSPKIKMAEVMAYSAIIKIENSLETNYNCNITVYNDDNGTTHKTITLFGCSELKITDLLPAQKYRITLEPDKSFYCDNSKEYFKTKYSFQYNASDFSNQEVTIITKFNPELKPDTNCTFYLYNGFKYININESTSCSKIHLKSLQREVEYQLNLTYDVHNYTVNFITASYYIIISNAVELTCNNVIFNNTFSPDLNESESPPCNGSLVNPDDTTFLCTDLRCELKCKTAKFNELKPNTKYRYYTGAYPMLTTHNEPSNFTTLSHSPYELFFTSITSSDGVLEIKHNTSIRYDCKVYITDYETNYVVFSKLVNTCFGQALVKLSPGRLYNMKLDLNSTIFCDTSEINFFTKYNVGMIPSVITTLSAIITATFIPTRMNKDTCKYNLSIKNDVIVSNTMTPCEKIELYLLKQNTNYELILMYKEYSYLTKFKTLPKHTISTTVSKITCSSVIFSNDFTPDTTESMIFICNGSLVKRNGDLFSCTDLSCNITCKKAVFSLLEENTKYTYNIGASPYYSNLQLSQTFTTLLYSPYRIDVIDVTETTLQIDIINKGSSYQSCNINLKVAGTETIAYEMFLSNCTGKKNITDLYPATIYNIKLEPNKSVYCDYLSTNVSTKYNVSMDFTTTTVSAKFEIKIKPEISKTNPICFINLHSPFHSKMQQYFNCKQIEIFNLLSYTIYVVNVTFKEYSYLASIKTNRNYSIKTDVFDKTCSSVKICNRFEPIIADLSTISCTNSLESESKYYDCNGRDCAKMCECISYLNLQPGADYNYFVASYPKITSLNFNKRFHIEPMLPFKVEQVYTEYSTIKVVLLLNKQETIPKCIYTITSVGYNYSKTYTLDICDSIFIPGLQPMQSYTLKLLPEPNNYCDTINLNITTIELLRNLRMIKTKTTEMLMSFSAKYIDENVHDKCYASVNKEWNNKKITYDLDSCLNFRIALLLPGTPYIIELRNKLSNITKTYTFLTKIEETLHNFTLFLNISQLKVSWENNITSTLEIGYYINLYLVNTYVNLQPTKLLIDSAICNASENTTIFNDLKVGMRYQIYRCARPLSYNCTNASQDNIDCFSCLNESFLVPLPIKYSLKSVEYNYKNDHINITYKLPSENEYGNITHCFVSYAILRTEFSGDIDFYDPNQKTFVKGNNWSTIKSINGSECSSSNFSLFRLHDKNDTLFSHLRGYFFYFALTYCSNVMCMTTKPSNRTYIPGYFSTVAKPIYGLTITIFVITFPLVILSLVIHDYHQDVLTNIENLKKKLARKSGNKTKSTGDKVINSTEPTQTTVEKEINSNEPTQSAVEKEINSTEPTQSTVEKEINSSEPTQSTVGREIISTESTQSTVGREIISTESTQSTVGNEINSTEPTPSTVEEKRKSRELIKAHREWIKKRNKLINSYLAGVLDDNSRIIISLELIKDMDTIGKLAWGSIPIKIPDDKWQYYTIERQQKMFCRVKNPLADPEVMRVKITSFETLKSCDQEIITRLKEIDGYLKFATGETIVKLVPRVERATLSCCYLPFFYDLKNPDADDSHVYHQYNQTRCYEPQSTIIAADDENEELNRDRKLLPGDLYLIPLKHDISGRYYVNAAKIVGLFGDCDYIAAQTPIRDTVEDFYSLIFCTDVEIVVMITDPSEIEEDLKNSYLPFEDGKWYRGRFTSKRKVIRRWHQGNRTNFIIILSEWEITLGFKTRKVIHFEYRLWPKESVPEDAETLLMFRRLVRNYQGSSKSPILVHCRDGSTRTGCFITIDYNLCRLENYVGNFAIHSYIKEIRWARPQMVCNYKQYDFIIKLLTEVVSQKLDD